MNPPTSDIAYAAGLFDGEGCVGAYGNSGSVVLHVTVAMTDRGIIDWLGGAFGGRVTLRKTNGRPKHWKPVYEWQLYNAAAKEFMTLLLPYLRVKSLQGWLASAWPTSTVGKHLSPEALDLRKELARCLKEAKRADDWKEPA